MAILNVFACTSGSTEGGDADAAETSDDGAIAPMSGSDAAVDHLITPGGDGTSEIDALHETDMSDGKSTDAPTIDGTVLEAVALFNGRDFAGWDTYLGPPNGAMQPVGLNRDPQGVFSIVMVDGGPAIHISGEIWGALTTQREFENYHLRAEYKWGTHAVWPPLTGRDSGLLYHSVGPFGAVQVGGGMLASPAGTGSFMTSMEFQIADNDVGSCYSLGPITVNGGAFASGAPMQFENPVGAWNTVEIFVLHDESVHVLNGHPVVHVRGATLNESDGGSAPLVRGKIQVQSESMEVFFRAITLAPIQQIPIELLDASP
jgi:hypothetical protein